MEERRRDGGEEERWRDGGEEERWRRGGEMEERRRDGGEEERWRRGGGMEGWRGEQIQVIIQMGLIELHTYQVVILPVFETTPKGQ